jgi:hypothetical protein
MKRKKYRTHDFWRIHTFYTLRGLCGGIAVFYYQSCEYTESEGAAV